MAKPTISPAASPKARWVTILIGLILLGLGGLLVRDALVAHNVINGGQIVNGIFGPADRVELTRPEVLWPVTIIAGLLALLFLFFTLAPRKKTHRSDGSVNDADHTPVWMKPVDIARIASHAANQTYGVADAHSNASRSSVTTTATVHSGLASSELARVESEVREAIAARLTPVAPSVTVKVVVRGAHTSQQKGA